MSQDPAPGPGATDLAALQTVLAGEHAAVYLFALLGARTSQSLAPTLFDAVRAAYVAHRDLRDSLTGTLAAAGTQPVASATAYRLPAGPGITLETAEGIGAAATALEAACEATYAAAVATSVGDVRRQAIGWLTTTAVRALAFRGTPEMFPGSGEHADR